MEGSDLHSHHLDNMITVSEQNKLFHTILLFSEFLHP